MTAAVETTFWSPQFNNNVSEVFLSMAQVTFALSWAALFKVEQIGFVSASVGFLLSLFGWWYYVTYKGSQP